MLSNEGEQALCRLLDSFIECFRWRMSICPQDLILRLKHTLWEVLDNEEPNEHFTYGYHP
jgi:hypothetical protein